MLYSISGTIAALESKSPELGGHEIVGLISRIMFRSAFEAW